VQDPQLPNEFGVGASNPPKFLLRKNLGGQDPPLPVPQSGMVWGKIYGK